ncbi:MAG: molybdopterin-synthase adenylyltransferase MoeB [Paracoccaceae bacterium]
MLGWFALVLIVAWFASGWAGIARHLRLALVGLLYLAALVVLLLSARASVGLWLVLGGIGALLAGYGQALRWLRARANPPVAEPAPRPGSFSDAELERYARHIVLREIGGPGQKRLRQGRVFVVGAGGLGAPALQYLAAAGVGTIGVIDDDVVDLSNLQRQVIHNDSTIGLPKVESAAIAMRALNPHIEVITHNRRFSPDTAAELLEGYDLVLDGTDNFATRLAVNAACVAAGKPLISGALSQWEGQISIFHPAAGTPCYQCIFPQAPAPGLAPSCAEAGVLSPLPGVVGAMMAAEAVKALVGAGEGLQGRMLIYDALYADMRVIGLKPRPDCPVCGPH